MGEKRFSRQMLNNLFDHLDDIAEQSDWEYGFVTDLMQRDEEGKRDLSDKQFKKLNEIHNRYVLGV